MAAVVIIPNPPSALIRSQLISSSDSVPSSELCLFVIAASTALFRETCPVLWNWNGTSGAVMLPPNARGSLNLSYGRLADSPLRGPCPIHRTQIVEICRKIAGNATSPEQSQGGKETHCQSYLSTAEPYPCCRRRDELGRARSALLRPLFPILAVVFQE